jgi:hypothetical protein
MRSELALDSPYFLNEKYHFEFFKARKHKKKGEPIAPLP